MKPKNLVIPLALSAATCLAADIPPQMQDPTWDKTFAENPAVEHQKIRFHNRYGIELIADLYKPKSAVGPLPAIAVSGPYGAVKEQVSGRYAQELASRGFLTIAFDPSFTGESGGMPRNLTSPEISTEDFSAAVDFFHTRKDVNTATIGILGVCGWGGFALNAAANDPRIKATVTSTMYDMSRVNAQGYFDKATPEIRYQTREKLNAQRTEDYLKNEYARDGGVPQTQPEDAPQFAKDYSAYYKSNRGYHPRSPNSNGGISFTSQLAFINMPILTYIEEIRGPVLLIHGEKAHSRYFSEDAFKRLKGDNKKLMIIPGANHTDLYDQEKIIPFAAIEAFYRDAFAMKNK